MTLFEMALLGLATAWGAGLALCYRLGLRDGLRAARGEAPRLTPGGSGRGGADAAGATEIRRDPGEY